MKILTIWFENFLLTLHSAYPDTECIVFLFFRPGQAYTKMAEPLSARWNECLARIKKYFGNDARFETWFSDTRALSLRGNHLTIEVPSQFYKERYETEFFPMFSRGVMETFGNDIRLTYSVRIDSGAKNGSMKLTRRLTPDSVGDPSTLVQAQAERKDKGGFDSHLNASLTFDNYCVGASNKLPWSIADSIAHQPVNSNFNPFFLYGDVGVGKTHLMQAIGMSVLKSFPEKKVLFLPMREFQRLYANAVIRKEIPAFLNWFMQVDVLLFDDLQELANKEKTLNDALFPIFNHLHQHGKQLVFTCDRPPQELEGIHDRLIDRFKWGVIEKLERPDAALRKKILTFKARKNGIELPADVIDLIAAAPLNSVREIESIVLGMMTRAINLGLDIDVNLASQVMKHSVKAPAKKAINFDMIVETTAEHFDLNSDVLFTKSRVKDVADARMSIMYLAHKILGLSTSSIGHKLGRKHSTVIHGIKAITDRLNTDSAFAETLSGIQTALV